MSRDDIEKLIISIGFKYNVYYEYKEYCIVLYKDQYSFYNGSEWIRNIYLNDLSPIKEHFKNELRSIKLKKILG